MSSSAPPSLVADLADALLVAARRAIDPERPAVPVDLDLAGLLERLHGVHRGTLPLLGPVALPEPQSLIGAGTLPRIPTLVRRVAIASGQTDRLPAYNTIDATVRRFATDPAARPTRSQSTVFRIVLEPLVRSGAFEELRAAIIDAAPGSAFGFAHVVGAWLGSARVEHPDSYTFGVLRQLIVDDGRLVRGGQLARTSHAGRLLPADDSSLTAIDDAVRRRQLRQLDTTLYLFAAQHAENGRALARAGYDERLFDPIYRAPYSRAAMLNRFFAVLRDHAGHSTWSALSLDGRPRVLGENSTSHGQLTKWRNGSRTMSRQSLERLMAHSRGFDPKRRDDDLAAFGEGYRVTLSVIGAAARLDEAVRALDPDPRSVLLERVSAYLDAHRADLGRWVPRPAFG